MPEPRMSTTTRLVLAVFLTDPAAPRYGLELCRAAGLASGTIHPILARLEAFGWLSSGWEDVDPAVAGRPARRYYRLTEDGETKGRTALAVQPVALPAAPAETPVAPAPAPPSAPAPAPSRPWTPRPGVSPA